jgi:hypothetical protein
MLVKDLLTKSGKYSAEDRRLAARQSGLITVPSRSLRLRGRYSSC